MKTEINKLKTLVTLVAALAMAHAASAFYDANLGRWINRDPLGERGFENVSDNAGAAQQSENPYSFAMNDPNDRIDPLGLLGCSAKKPCCSIRVKCTGGTYVPGIFFGECWFSPCVVLNATGTCCPPFKSGVTVYNNDGDHDELRSTGPCSAVVFPKTVTFTITK